MSTEKRASGLPQDTFKYRVAWMLFEVLKAHALPTRRIFLILLSRRSRRTLYFETAACSLSFLAYVVFDLGCGWHQKRKHVLSHHLRELSEAIIIENPGLSWEKWDLVTIRINNLLYEQSAWSTKYCLFDGKQTYDIFGELTVDRDVTPEISRATDLVQQALTATWDQQAVPFHSSGKICEHLPRQKYRNKWFWTIHQNYLITQTLHVVVFASAFFAAVVGAIMYHETPTTTRGACDLIFRLYYICLMALIISGGHYNFRSIRLGLKSELAFLKVVESIKPASDLKAWDKIAQSMNLYLFDQNVWPNKDFHFEGKDCKRHFENKFVDGRERKRFASANLLPFIKKALKASSGDELQTKEV